MQAECRTSSRGLKNLSPSSRATHTFALNWKKSSDFSSPLTIAPFRFTKVVRGQCQYLARTENS